ncbi:MAG TPA: Bax inhibitor-1/YccA family protein [Myxococcales bacterium LLY-WYZ-16_1]|nr:Bax inhibitor-1/YccA family protein [Myxococcales bacterium LLY-WYZ-16_1]
MRSANPALNDKTFGLPGDWASPVERASRMSLPGTVTKTGILLAMVVFAASFTWTSPMKNPEGIYSWVIGGALVGFGLAMVTVFEKAWSSITGPLHALAEGLPLGGLSAFLERQFPGIVIHAVSLAFGVAFALLLDFDFIEEGAEQGAPKYMEWNAAFGLVVTLVWPYLEMLRLQSKLQSRN